MASITVHPDALGNTDHCGGCGRYIPPDEERVIAILGTEDGGEVLITRFCLDCPETAAQAKREKHGPAA